MGSTRKTLKTRRQFLKEGTSLALTLPWLGGCQNLDRLVLGEYREESERVVIVGAGLAGLMAAYQLKKRQIPFQIFEASPRIGGRLYSLPDFQTGQPVAELGAEWFHASQRLVFQTAQELKVEIYESKERISNSRFRSGDRLVPLREIGGEMARLQRALRKEATDETSTMHLREWCEANSKNVNVREMIFAWAEDRYGVPAEKIGAWRFVNELKNGTTPLSPWTDQRFRFRSGASAMVSALFERVAGFQPEKTFSFHHRWKSVRLRPRGYELYFDTPTGEKSILTHAVICTVPAPTLLRVEGVRDLPGPWDQPDEFRMGSHSKVLLSYGKRFWANQMDQGQIFSFLPNTNLCESSFRQNLSFQFRQGILTATYAGEAANKVAPSTPEALTQEINKVFKQTQPPPLLDQALINWSQNPLFMGSVSTPPLQRRPSPWAQKASLWQWAGEHTSEQWPGTLQGALESGLVAVERVLRTRTAI